MEHKKHEELIIWLTAFIQITWNQKYVSGRMSARSFIQFLDVICILLLYKAVASGYTCTLVVIIFELKSVKWYSLPWLWCQISFVKNSCEWFRPEYLLLKMAASGSLNSPQMIQLFFVIWAYHGMLWWCRCFSFLQSYCNKNLVPHLQVFN